MTSNQYLTYGLITLMGVFIHSYFKPTNVDWTKMPDPRSAGFQAAIMASVFFCVLAWPIVWLVFGISALMGGKDGRS